VTFKGFVSEQRKRELLASAKAVLFSALNEDFGMVPVEALAAGTPVIGVDDGFTRFQIADGKNGMLFKRGELPAAIRRFERHGVAWDADQLHEFAAVNFGRERFEREMGEAVAAAERETAVDPDWTEPMPETGEIGVAMADGGES